MESILRFARGYCHLFQSAVFYRSRDDSCVSLFVDAIAGVPPVRSSSPHLSLSVGESTFVLYFYVCCITECCQDEPQHDDKEHNVTVVSQACYVSCQVPVTRFSHHL